MQGKKGHAVVNLIVGFLVFTSIGLLLTSLFETLNLQNKRLVAVIETLKFILPGSIDAFGMIKNFIYSLVFTFGVETFRTPDTPQTYQAEF